jgi:hypothetical protein
LQLAFVLSSPDVEKLSAWLAKRGGSKEYSAGAPLVRHKPLAIGPRQIIRDSENVSGLRQRGTADPA